MFKFENIIESLIEKKITKSKSVNNDKDLQKEELIQQIICFIERIIESTILNYIDPINEKLRHFETQIFLIQGQLMSFHQISPKNKELKEIPQNQNLSSNHEEIALIQEKINQALKQNEKLGEQLSEFKHENKKSFFSYWVMLNDLNESVNKIKDQINFVDENYQPKKVLTRLSTQK